MSETIAAPEVKRPTAAEKKFAKQKAVVKDAILAATEQFYKKNQYDKVAAGGGDEEKIRKLEAECEWLRQNVGTVNAQNMSRILSILMGKPVSYMIRAGTALNWVRFAAIVPITAGTLGHNYQLNRVAVITQDTRGIRYDGTLGNGLDNRADILLPATKEQIEQITDETYAALIREFLIMAE